MRNLFRTNKETKKVVFVITRFSLLLNNKNWKISRENSFDAYKKKLFSEERMSEKFLFFRNLYIPAFKAAKSAVDGIELKSVLLISDELPQPNLDELQGLIEDDDSFEALKVKKDDDYNDILNAYISNFLNDRKESIFATVRLDDDDLLSVKFFDSIEKYLNVSFVSRVISFPRGIECYFDSNKKKLDTCLSLSVPRIALGLTHINKYSKSNRKFTDPVGHIYNCGDHSNIHNRYNLVSDHQQNMFLRMNSDSQDTKGSGVKKGLKNKNSRVISEEAVISLFPELKNIVKTGD